MTVLSNAVFVPPPRNHFLLSYSPQNMPAFFDARAKPPPLHLQSWPFPTKPSFQGAEALNFLHFHSFERRRAPDALAPRAALPLRIGV
jgi:hypothetical protein